MKVQDFEFSKTVRKDVGILDFVENIKIILNLGRYQMRVVATAPTHTGEGGEHLLYISGNTKRLYWWDDTNETWQYSASVVASASLTGQDAVIGATTLFTPTATGVYEVSVYQVCTTAGTGTLTTTIGWTDDAQAQTMTPASNIDLSGKGNAASGVAVIQATAVAITYTVTIADIAGSPEYSLYIRLKQV